jgi:hypothetical protein
MSTVRKHVYSNIHAVAGQGLVIECRPGEITGLIVNRMNDEGACGVFIRTIQRRLFRHQAAGQKGTGYAAITQ